MDPQRRKAPRHQVPLLVGDGEMLLGHTRDISQNGLFVLTGGRRRPELSSVFTISFAWDRDVYSCRARVVRQDHEGVGLSFIDTDNELSRALDEAAGIAKVA